MTVYEDVVLYYYDDCSGMHYMSFIILNERVGI